MTTRERNQNTIRGNLPGQWAIYSTVTRAMDPAEAQENTDVELIYLAQAVGPTAVLDGYWEGEEEASLMVYGSKAFDVARNRAAYWNQDAFIYAPGDGTAELWNATRNATGGIVTYNIINVFTGIEIVKPMENGDFAFEDDNFSVLPSGLAFRLVA